MESGKKFHFVETPTGKPNTIAETKQPAAKMFTKAEMEAGGAYKTYQKEGGTLEYVAWVQAGYPRGSK